MKRAVSEWSCVVRRGSYFLLRASYFVRWGFRTRGVGPREVRHTATGDGAGPKVARDALGGDVMAVGTAALSVAQL